MKKIIVLFVLFVIAAAVIFTATKVYAAGSGKVWAIHYDVSTGWPFPGRKGDMNTFQVGWDLGIQIVNYNPGDYTLTITRKESGLTVYGPMSIHIYSKSIRNINLYPVPPEYAGYSYIVKFGGKTDTFRVAN